MWLPFTWRTFSGDGVAAQRVAHDLDPGPGDVDDRARRDLGRRTTGGRERRAPVVALAPRAGELRAHADVRAQLARRHLVGQHEPRVVDARVGVDESLVETVLQPGAPFRRLQVDAERAGSVIRGDRWSYMKRPARIIHAGRRCGSCGSTNESGCDEVRRLMQHDFALGERLARRA